MVRLRGMLGLPWPKPDLADVPVDVGGNRTSIAHHRSQIRRPPDWRKTRDRRRRHAPRYRAVGCACGDTPNMAYGTLPVWATRARHCKGQLAAIRGRASVVERIPLILFLGGISTRCVWKSFSMRIVT